MIFLGHMPREISRLTKLRFIIIGNDKDRRMIGDFPIEIAHLPFIQYINIRSHNFSSLYSYKIFKFIFFYLIKLL